MRRTTALLCCSLVITPAASWKLAAPTRRSLVSAAVSLAAVPLPSWASVIEEAKAFDSKRAAGSGVPEQHLATVSAKSKSINLVAKVTVTAPQNGDVAEYIWLKDADTGAVIAASKGANPLVTSIDKGKTVIPVVKYKADGTWESKAVLLAPGFSNIL